MAPVPVDQGLLQLGRGDRAGAVGVDRAEPLLDVGTNLLRRRGTAVPSVPATGSGGTGRGLTSVATLLRGRALTGVSALLGWRSAAGVTASGVASLLGSPTRIAALLRSSAGIAAAGIATLETMR